MSTMKPTIRFGVHEWRQIWLERRRDGRQPLRLSGTNHVRVGEKAGVCCRWALSTNSKSAPKAPRTKRVHFSNFENSWSQRHLAIIYLKAMGVSSH
ncbi:hypothetical protein CDAR_544031 [Caerostris darwini]|uniref:Uncharacterized protein n=1 Tax=Caerostris darwini TaxID=1538125 RepID=A0AAV4TP96_9ARAC|nr:hypothetical protein CDAR_544031 [Caerostris darwini]